MTIFKNASPPVPAGKSFKQGLRERWDAMRPFLRWLSHFVVNGFVAGIMIGLYSMISLLGDFSDQVARGLNAELAVRVVFAPEIPKEKALALAKTLSTDATTGEEFLSYQTYDSEQARALLGIRESWMPELPELILAKLPIVLELRQYPGHKYADLSQIAAKARMWTETDQVYFNDSGWMQTKQISNDLQYVGVFFSRFMTVLLPGAIVITCLLSGLGIRHRRLWLLVFGVASSAAICRLTMLGMDRVIHRILIETTSVTKSAVFTVNADTMPVQHTIFAIVVVFWAVIEATRLRLRRRA